MQTNNNCPHVLSDQDMIQDMLSEEKSLISGYGTFIPEAACPQLRRSRCSVVWSGAMWD